MLHASTVFCYQQNKQGILLIIIGMDSIVTEKTTKNNE